MISRLRTDFRTVVVAALTAAVTAGGAPALAHGVRHALFAHNSDKVDGKHAVGEDATLSGAAGKLVAHDTSGMLPARFLPKVAAATNADNAGRLDGIDSTGFYRFGSKVADADRLDGLGSSAFVGTCKTGSIRGYIGVNGNLSIPSAFSTTGTRTPFNCAGSAPLVRRIDTGTYELCFPKNLSTVGIGNAVYMGEDSDLDNFITLYSVLTPHCSTTTFRVRVRDNDGDLENAPFFLAVL